jgi:hypothetical protein
VDIAAAEKLAQEITISSCFFVTQFVRNENQNAATV